MIDIIAAAAKLIHEELDIPEEDTKALIAIGAMDEYTLKKMLIRKEYERSRIPRKIDLKYHLAERYCVSISTIEKYTQT